MKGRERREKIKAEEIKIFALHPALLTHSLVIVRALIARLDVRKHPTLVGRLKENLLSRKHS